MSRSDPSWRATVPGREGDEEDASWRASTSESDEYATDVGDGDDDDSVMRAGDVSESEEDVNEGVFEDARETLGRGGEERDALNTTGLLAKAKKASTKSQRSGKTGVTRSRGSNKSRALSSGKSSREMLRRKAERRAYKPVTFGLLLRLFGLYAAFGVLILACVLITSLGAIMNPTGEVLVLNALENIVWMIISLASFVAIPSCLAHVTGYLTWPPVWLEAFPERAKLLEELGGKIYVRFHVARDAKPLAVRRAVDVAVDVLQRSLPTTLFEVEVVSYKDLGISAPSVSELVVPVEMNDRYFGSGGLLSYATRASSASWGDWVVHMGSDALLNMRAVDAVLAHCARETRLAALSGRADTHVRRLAQGAVLPGITRTSNSFIDGVESAFQWIPAMAECIRAGESYGALRMMYAKHSRVVAPIPNTYLVVPNELELAVGFNDMDVHDGFELTSFALRCSNSGVKFSWLDAGVHVPIVGNIWKLFKSRARDHHSALVLMRDENALDHVHRASLTLACVSGGFCTVAPVITAFAPWCLRRSGPDTFAASCVVGFITACVTFKYAVGFYKSASVADLSQGVMSGTIYYNILFILTVVLTPVFSVFEFIALCTSVFYNPKYFGAEHRVALRPTVTILKHDDDEDFDWIERGDRSLFQEKEKLLSEAAPSSARSWRRDSKREG